MNGVINIYKEAGVTSFDVVAEVKKILKVSKCGHLGTLDPMAEGVLPICVGYATRFADYLSSVDKEYIAEFKLGETSDSYDSTGTILEANQEIKPEFNQVKEVFANITGNIELTVPAFSAKKINGVRAYKLARTGEIKDAGLRLMEIYSIDLLTYDYPYGVIRVSCGKGTYIRSIINEAGLRLKCGALMSGLIRSCNGIFKSNNAVKLDNLRTLVAENSYKSIIIPVTELLHWGKAVVKDSVIQNIKNGKSPTSSSFLSLPIEHEGNSFFIMDTKGSLIAVAERVEGTECPLRLKMVFNH